jgi:hypothetical protein
MSEHTGGQGGGWEPREEGEAWKTQDIPQPRGRLHGVVLETMRERGWTFDDLGDGMIRARVHCKAADFEVFVSSLEEMRVVRCWVLMPVRIEEMWRGATVDLFNRINFGHLLLGGFELDPEDGAPRWRAALDVEGGELVTQMVHNLINAGLSLCDTFWPAVMAVSVLGTSPEAALRIVTEG